MDFAVDTVFVPSTILPKDLQVSTPFTFPILDGKFVMAFDKTRCWNALGGHIEEGETWQDALEREAREEAGVQICKITIFGYVEATRVSGKSPYPNKTILPFTVSEVKDVDLNWTSMETTKRSFFTMDEALEALRLRDDNQQMLEIFQYMVSQQIAII